MYRVKRLCLLLIFALSLFPNAALAEGSADSPAHPELDAIGEALNLIKAFDLSDVSSEELRDAAIQGMIDYLNDPYASYFNAENQDQLLNAINNRKVGMGVTFEPNAAVPIIRKVFDDSPAAKAGLLKGDQLLVADGVSLKDDDANNRLSALLNTKKAGDPLKLSIQRKDQVKSITLKLELFEFPTVEEKLLPSGIGYIRLRMFAQGSDREFAKAVERLQAQGIKNLVIDLRDNPGGLIDAAKQIAGHLMPKGTLLIAKDKDGKKTNTEFSGPSSITVPVEILVNGQSASASEMLAGAMQDYERAVIIGETTYGKGVYQKIFPLLNGGGRLTFTVGEYLTPNGRSVNKVGIKPDIVESESASQLVRALRLGGLSKPSISFSDNQLTVGKASFDEKVPFFDKDGKRYVSIAFLAALAGGEVSAQPVDKTVRITRGKQSASYSASRGYIVQEGIGYLSMDTFIRDFPEAKWRRSGQSTIITIK